MTKTTKKRQKEPKRQKERHREASRFNRIIAAEFTELTAQKLDLTRKISQRKNNEKRKEKEDKKKSKLQTAL